jgi:hypothetical protein
MLANWLSQWKWALVIAIFAGPAFAYWSFTEGQTFKRIMADGIETTAVVDGGESRTRRGVTTSTKIHAIWTDANGAERAESIEVSSEYAKKIIDGDYLVIEEAKIKYLPDEPDVEAIVTEDGPQRVKDEEMMMYLGGGAGVIGLIGAPIVFLAGRKKKPEPAKKEPATKSNLGF